MSRLVAAIREFKAFLSREGGGLRQRTLRSSIWVALGTAGVGSLSFIKTIILARLLTPESFGLMALCMMVVRGIQVFSETGLASALIQRPGSVENARHTVYSLTVLRGAALGTLLALFSPIIASLYEQPVLSSLLNVLALSLVLSGFYNVSAVVLQKELSFLAITRLQLSVAVLDIVVVSALAYWLRNVWALVIGQVLTAAISVALSFAYLPGKPQFGWDTKLMRELFSYGRFITGLTIVIYITTEIDNAVIGKVLGVEALGVYAVVYMLANLPATHLSKVLAKVMFPAYSKIQSHQPALHKACLMTNRLVAIFAFPVAVGLAALGDDIVRIIYGPEWQAPPYVMAVLCIFGAVRSLGAINGYLLNAVGRPDIVFYNNLAKLIVIAAVIIPATNQFGLLGAACAVAIPAVLGYLIGLWILSRVLRLGLGRILGSLAPSAVTAGAMGVLLELLGRWIEMQSLISLLLVVTSGAVFYGAMNWSRIKEAAADIVGRRNWHLGQEP